MSAWLAVSLMSAFAPRRHAFRDETLTDPAVTGAKVVPELLIHPPRI